MQLDEIARRIVQEGLPARAHGRGIADRHPSRPQLRHGRVEVGYPQRQVLAAILGNRSLDQVHLLIARIKPGAANPEIRPVGALHQTKPVYVEPQRGRDISDVDGYVVNPEHAHIKGT